jgi:hypothetical protein
MTMPATVKPFFSYYGGKFRAAPRYPKPAFPHIVEPFAGSAGYALRYPHLRVTLVDKSPVIAEVWRYLIDVPEAEIRALPVLPPDGHLDDYPRLPLGAQYLIGFWLNRGTTRPERKPSAWHRGFQATGERPLSRWSEQAKARIASQLHRIRHWTVVEGSYQDGPAGPATRFVDPPYNNKAGKRYPVRGLDFDALGMWCRAQEGQTIVCEQEGADWLPFRPFATLKATEGKNRTPSREVIWTNAG